MELDKELVQNLQSTTPPDWNVQQPDDSRYAVLSRDEPSAVDIQVGPRYDGTLAVVATHHREFSSFGIFPYPVEYRRAETVTTAVGAVSDFIEKYREPQHLSTESVGNVAPAEEVIDYLIDNGAEFVAVPEDLLAYGICSLVWLASSDTDDSAITQYLQGLDVVTVDGHPLPFTRGINTRPMKAHFGARVPVYSSGQVVPEIDQVERDRGLTNLRNYDFSASPTGRFPIEPQTTNLETLLRQLVNAGAAAIAVEKEVSRPERLSLVANIPPAIGYEIVAEYSSIEFAGRERDVSWVCDMGGPHFSFRVPLYASDDIVGVDSIQLSEGLDNLRKFVSEEADAQREAGDVS